MADTFAWDVTQLERTLSDGAVYNAYWSVIATREEANDTEEVNDTIYTADRRGTVSFGAPDPNNFTPYDQLTKNQVVGWVLNALGNEQVETICEGLTAQLNNKQNPVDALGIPW